ncbi:MAG: hypothetical protein QM723_12540 [Myxococcaceae bacterium]
MNPIPQFLRANTPYRALEQSVRVARKTAQARAYWRSRPINHLSRQGYELVPPVLNADECKRLCSVADSLLRDESYFINQDCYLSVRKEKGMQIDVNVRQVMNLHAYDPAVKALFDSGKLEQMFVERLGEPVKLESITLQVDDVDTEKKRGYHLDSAWPPRLKVFTYLSPVDELGDGPYTVIPRSHVDLWRKVGNRFFNATRGFPHDDMRLGYDDNGCVPLLGPAGTTILSTQDIVHKGWHDHHRSRRYNLISYLCLERFWDGKPFALGRDRIKPKA